ncbi:MAG: M48 family metallopeptidase [Betaproteobacteria bacterium]|jgi:STE24 endopeptidase|uniref:M48 family metallopeptidase n=1 Tax=Polynucleobacter finlandensis TaxID=1855894 RepID=UPI001C0AC982|nr:M48 family metallopeptidase [Polynucleobacter finlandensis]MBU3543804.1 M48 family metallopeptidase [Polynucleobacter finlandensis]
MTFTIAFLIAFLASFGLRHWLAQRQMRFVAKHRDSVPAEFAEKVTLAEHQKAADYTIAKLRLGVLENGVSAIILIGFTLLGGLQILNISLSQLLGDGITQQIALLGSIAIISGIVDLPFSWYKQFHLEERFGFNRMGKQLFFIDMIKGLGVGAAIGIPLLWVILSLMAKAGDLWWLWAWVVLTVFSLLMQWIFPSFIAPLFNKFQPLPDGALKTQIEALLARCEFASQGLFVMDGSKRSAHGNAFFAGMGKAKRIVFFDTLIEKLNPGEVEAVLAHELGHFKCKHIRKRLLVSFALSFGMFALLGWISTQVWFYTDLGVMPNLNGYNGGLALALFMLVSPVFSFFFTPLASIASRKHEYEADGFAATKSSAKDLISALVKLYQDNASTLTPDPIYTAFYSSHPPAPLRIANLQRQS